MNLIPPLFELLKWPELEKASVTHKISRALIAAIIMTESACKPSVTRYEENYRWLVSPETFAAKLGITLKTETIAQKHSYGLMQVMGANCRAAGYQGYLAEMVTPALALEYGCRHFSLLLRKYDLAAAISAYNQGTPRTDKETGSYLNESYVSKVLKYHSEITAFI
jgi:hypothetical protein